MKTTFTGDEFVKALSEGGLQKPLMLTGMVKKSEDPTVILFAPGTLCRNWVPIKASCIEEVKWLGNVSCRDHSHEYVSIHIKDVGAAEATLFADLLKVYVEAYEISEKSKLVPQATASAIPSTGSAGDSTKPVYPSPQTVGGCYYPNATVRGCYYGATVYEAYQKCDLDRFRGIMNGWWTGGTCNYPSSCCSDGGVVLVTNPQFLHTLQWQVVSCNSVLSIN